MMHYYTVNIVMHWPTLISCSTKFIAFFKYMFTGNSFNIIKNFSSFLSYGTLSIDSELKTNIKNFLLDWIILLVEILMMKLKIFICFHLQIVYFKVFTKYILYIELSLQCGNLNKTIFTLMLPDHCSRILKWVLIQLIWKVDDLEILTLLPLSQF